MSDSETPDATPGDTPGPTPSDSPGAAVPQDGSQAMEAPSSGTDRLEGVKRPPASSKRLWVAVAGLCVAVGTVGSALGAHALAHRTPPKRAKRSLEPPGKSPPR